MNKGGKNVLGRHICNVTAHYVISFALFVCATDILNGLNRIVSLQTLKMFRISE